MNDYWIIGQFTEWIKWHKGHDAPVTKEYIEAYFFYRRWIMCILVR